MRRFIKLLWILWAGGITEVHSRQPENMCGPLIQLYEASHGIPHKLLTAIALVESGRKIGNTVVPWPWSINVKGKSYVFNSKEEAIAGVRKFRRKGITSIDVGCMQVNLKYHPKAFSSLEAAFDPATNIAYASKFLKSKKINKGSWGTAIAHYHSSRPKFHLTYRKKVLKKWAKVRNIPMSLYIPLREKFPFPHILYPESQEYKKKGAKVAKVITPRAYRLPLPPSSTSSRGFQVGFGEVSPLLAQEHQEIPEGPKIIRINPNYTEK